MTETQCRTWLALLVFTALIVGTAAAHTADLVTDLPGQPPVRFKQYAGYVTLEPGPKERNFFYWFFEADHPNASSRPVALWLQGGPGCSATGLGALGEIGPFLMTDYKLVVNRYSWNKEVNLIFVDSPVGTGYSYTNDANYTLNDYNTAVDSYKFLLGWLEKFPEYSTNELYLLGESYAGHYVPQLALQILIENQRSPDTKLNFRGFNLGNPWTDSFIDNKGTLLWYLSHSIISEETFNLALLNCNLSTSFYIGQVGNAACKEGATQIGGDLAEVVLENVYESACNMENTTTSFTNALLFKRMQSRRQRLSSNWHHGQNPCGDGGVQKYLNNPAVQKALHIPFPIFWTDCSDPVGNNYSYVDSVASVLPVYRQLLKTGIKMWIYSGDWDGNVPTTGTRGWIKSLELPIVMKWRPWDYKSQVGGWTQRYQGLTFTTVRGAGHMVPTDQPGKALDVLRSFLADEPLPMFHLVSRRRDDARLKTLFNVENFSPATPTWGSELYCIGGIYRDFCKKFPSVTSAGAHYDCGSALSELKCDGSLSIAFLCPSCTIYPKPRVFMIEFEKPTFRERGLQIWSSRTMPTVPLDCLFRESVLSRNYIFASAVGSVFDYLARRTAMELSHETHGRTWN